jgi:hypothetical protein
MAEPRLGTSSRFHPVWPSNCGAAFLIRQTDPRRHPDDDLRHHLMVFGCTTVRRTIVRRVCYHFATQLLNMWQDRTVSDDQRRTPKPNKISRIDINDDW